MEVEGREIKRKGGTEKEKRKGLEGKTKESEREERKRRTLSLLSCHQTPEWTAVNWTLITAEK